MSLLFSCVTDDVTDDDTGTDPVVVVKKIHKIFVDDVINREYLYTGNKLQKVIYYSPDGDVAGHELRQYLSETQIKQELYIYPIGEGEAVKNRYYLYDYESDLVVKRTKYNFNEGDETALYKGYALYTNRDNLDYNLVEAKYYDEDDILTYRFEINYTDDNASSEAAHYNAAGDFIKNEYWSRDNKIGWMQEVSFYPYQHTHNLVDKEIVLADGSTSDDSYTSIYEYDADNYPTSQTRTYHDGTVKEYLFVYYPVE